MYYYIIHIFVYVIHGQYFTSISRQFTLIHNVVTYRMYFSIFLISLHLFFLFCSLRSVFLHRSSHFYYTKTFCVFSLHQQWNNGYSRFSIIGFSSTPGEHFFFLFCVFCCCLKRRSRYSMRFFCWVNVTSEMNEMLIFLFATLYYLSLIA